MRKFLVTICALGLLLSFASAEEASVRDEALSKRNSTRYRAIGNKAEPLVSLRSQSRLLANGGFY
jgi:hypothetical protein